MNDEGFVNAHAAAGRGELRCKALWTVQVPGDPMWRSTPAVGKTTIFVGGDNRLHAFASAGCGASTCRPLWTVQFKPGSDIEQVDYPPAVSRGAVYAAGSVSQVARFSLT